MLNSIPLCLFRVKYAVNSETSEPVAIKVLDKEKIQKQNMGPQIKKEISIMKIVRHKYVVGMKEVLASRTKIFIVLELVTGGELFDKIVSEGKFSEEMARFYCRQLVEGVEYCHNLGVCHRDLKPENLLLDEQGNLKISDFGLSALYVGDADGDGTSRTELLHTTCGTPNYVAPEVLADKGYEGKKADVWSIGVILYVLLAGFLPFDESTIVALFAKIQAADFTYPKWFSPSVRSLLDSIITADPKARLTLTEVRDAPWLTFDDGDKAYHPVPSLNENVAAARTAARENADGNDDDDDESRFAFCCFYCLSPYHIHYLHNLFVIILSLHFFVVIFITVRRSPRRRRPLRRPRKTVAKPFSPPGSVTTRRPRASKRSPTKKSTMGCRMRWARWWSKLATPRRAEGPSALTPSTWSTSAAASPSRECSVHVQTR